MPPKRVAPAPKRAAPWRAIKADTVEAYLAALPPPERKALTALRKTIRKAAPRATEAISYQVPTFRHDGGLVAFSASPKHCALHLMSPALMRALRQDLAGYETGAATIRFTAETPLPARLVTMLVKARLAENAARVSARAPSRRRPTPSRA
jgi:uncharacterized protein YdhG (YjbR/CyaY superfamily)